MDFPVICKDASVLEITRKTVSALGFSDQLGMPMIVNVVHTAIVYNDPDLADSYLLVIHNILWVKSMNFSITNPFPKFLAPLYSIANHSLFFLAVNVQISLVLDTMISYLPCQMLKGKKWQIPA